MNKDTKKVKEYFEFRINNFEALGCYPDAKLKRLHGQLGRNALRALARLLGLTDSKVTYNPSGTIDGGYVTLIGMKGNKGIYVQISCTNTPWLGDVLYRTVNHMKDYTGGRNNHMHTQDFVRDPSGSIQRIASLIGMQQVSNW